MQRVVIIDATLPPAECAYCHQVKDLRPYGKDGARICFDCAMKPENKETTELMLQNVLDGKDNQPTQDQNN